MISDDIAEDIFEKLPLSSSRQVPQIRLGPVASGMSVVADDSTIASVKKQNRKLLGIDMEAFAVHAAVNESSYPKPAALTMKSVVDFADSEKSDDHQEYAAYVSAQVLARFAGSYLTK